MRINLRLRFRPRFVVLVAVTCCLISFAPAERTIGSEQGTAAAINVEIVHQDAAKSESSSDEAPLQRGQRLRSSRGVYKAQIAPTWFPQDSGFWYRNDLSDGKREFVLIDAVAGTRAPAFDHARLAEAFQKAGVADAQADRLPLTALEFDREAGRIEFTAADKYWQCSLQTYELIQLEKRHEAQKERLAQLNSRNTPGASTRNGSETTLTFLNKSSVVVELFWLDAEGERRSYGKLEPGERHEQRTFEGHVWEIVDREGKTLARYQAIEADAVAEIAGNAVAPVGVRRASAGSDRRRSRGVSPDGKWIAFINEHNLYVRPADQGDEIQLSHDGDAGNEYGLPTWAPDSTTLVAFRVESADEKKVYLIESAPRGGGRALLHERPYALPGDKFSAFELNIFDIARTRQLKPEVDRIDFGYPNVRWNRESGSFTYEKIDRGHQRFRLMEIKADTGAARTLIDEQTDTFIWSAHTESADVRRITWLEKSNEIVYASERDGWRHLYLVDAVAGTIKNRITQGEWVVRGIDRIDEERRQIWFRASGMVADQDPYFIHFYRVNFDGTGLVALTAGDGNHSIQYSPDQQFLIDTFSRVDLPPAHVLRRTSDGGLVCELEQADVSELRQQGWQPPEVFVAKGRDGKTDIWGIICRPAPFDPSKKYPVIESIYAGPQGSFVPKSFSSEPRFATLVEMGFIVVQIDGMGTANRSKAFHDVCWKNLKDAGLPDRILWHQDVARKYASYDLERVGIYGTSAGGQNSTAAVLFHPEFYKVAVSACGCHDNRMDKASWNEQWMGYPVGKQYSECSNIDNAHKLRGKLMLIVGEMDNNVPPESTMRLADALIKSSKDFELVVVPGAGHGMGGPFGSRKMHEFFARHLSPTAAAHPKTNSDVTAVRQTENLGSDNRRPER